MIFRILGELTIGPEDNPLELPRSHTLRMLAALLINANKRMSKSELLLVGWGITTPGEAQLPKHAGRLRMFLEQVGLGDNLMAVHGYGYELKVTEEHLDMLLFERLVRDAGAAKQEGRVQDEVELLSRALRLWRGPFVLSNLPRELFQQDAKRLEGRRRRAAVRLFELEVERGNHALILEDLEVVFGYYPSDNKLCKLLMIALYRSGHATQALEAYETYTRALEEETAGPPDPELRKLAYDISRGQGNTVPPDVDPRAPTVPHQLPRDVTDFVGRESLAAEVCWLLSERDRVVPVVVIHGQGGIGKTALAVHIAHEVIDSYPGGQLFVELHGTSPDPADPVEVLGQFLRSFGVSRVPESREERVAMYRTILAERQVLVVLDDARDEAHVRDLIPGSPTSGVIITARRRLPHISGVHHTAPLATLDHATATELFLHVARGSGINPQSEMEAVIRVVGLCAGLPLALRIAGALRVRDHPRPTADLAERLIRQGQAALAYGEESVARSIGVGFDLLDADAQRLFLWLGLVQLPTFGLWTAAAILDGTGADPAAALSQLVAGYMVQPAEQDGRYRFHDLTREYAHRRALDAYPRQNERTRMLDRVYTALLTLIRRAHRGLYGGDYEVVHGPVEDWDAPPGVLAEVDESVKEWFLKERANIRAAVTHCADPAFADLCWDLAISSHEFYGINQLYDDWYATHMVALEVCRRTGDRRGEAMMLVSLGQPTLVASRRSGRVSGPEDLRRAVDLLGEGGADDYDRHAEAIALRTLGNALRRRGWLAQPLELFTRALKLYEASGDVLGHAQTLRYIGHVHLDRGEHREALNVLRAAAEVASGFGRQAPFAQGNYWVGQACLALGDLESAKAAFEVVLAVSGAGGGVGYAYAAHGLGDVARMSGNHAEANRLLSIAGTVAHESADAALEGRVWLSKARFQAALGNTAEQIAALERAATCFSGCDAVLHEAGALSALSRAHAKRGDAAKAELLRARVEHLYQAMEIPEEDRRPVL